MRTLPAGNGAKGALPSNSRCFLRHLEGEGGAEYADVPCSKAREKERSQNVQSPDRNLKSGAEAAAPRAV